MAKVWDAYDYARRADASWSSCPFCGTSTDEGTNGLEIRACPKCRELYERDMRRGRVPQGIYGTGAGFDFFRWAVLRRAEADAANAGWSSEQTRQLVDSIVGFWTLCRTRACEAMDEEKACIEADRAAMNERYSY